jgi:hypothetical protein
VFLLVDTGGEVVMSEPLKVMLIVACIVSGMYILGLAKNIASTGRVDPNYVLPVFLSFISVMALGFLIWGIVALVQNSRRARIHRPTTRHT